MVLVEDVIDKVEEGQADVSASEDRRLDADAIEQLLSSVQRVSAKMRLEALVKQLRKESEALARLEKSKKLQESNQEENQQETANVTSTAAPISTLSPTSVTEAIPIASSVKYTAIDRFAFDDGGYSGAFVTLYVDIEGVGNIPREKVTCDFTNNSFDLVIKDLDSKCYRLFRDNLEKEINPEKSKIIVKPQKVVVKLAKVKGEYGYDHWSKLTDTKKKTSGGSDKKSDPQASIMEMMKNMYDEGDDNMKKMISETMMKQRRGELGNDMSGGMPGMDGIGDL